MTFTYRFANDEERAWMAEQAQAVSEVVEFRSMATVGDERALTQVKAVDTAYPLAGTLRLQPDIPLENALAGEGDLPGVAMMPVLADRLGLKPGDPVRFGTRDFVLMATIKAEPDAAAAADAGSRSRCPVPGCASASSPRTMGSRANTAGLDGRGDHPVGSATRVPRHPAAYAPP